MAEGRNQHYKGAGFISRGLTYPLRVIMRLGLANMAARRQIEIAESIPWEELPSEKDGKDGSVAGVMKLSGHEWYFS